MGRLAKREAREEGIMYLVGTQKLTGDFLYLKSILCVYNIYIYNTYNVVLHEKKF